jgi:hypothetical protein
MSMWVTRFPDAVLDAPEVQALSGNSFRLMIEFYRRWSKATGGGARACDGITFPPSTLSGAMVKNTFLKARHELEGAKIIQRHDSGFYWSLEVQKLNPAQVEGGSEIEPPEVQKLNHPGSKTEPQRRNFGTPEAQKLNPIKRKGDSKEIFKDTKEAESEFFFPLKSGSLWNLPPATLEAFQDTFGAKLDVEHELKSAALWLEENPAKKKTASDMLRYVGGWLRRAKPPAELVEDFSNSENPFLEDEV